MATNATSKTNTPFWSEVITAYEYIEAHPNMTLKIERNGLYAYVSAQHTESGGYGTDHSYVQIVVRQVPQAAADPTPIIDEKENKSYG